MELISESRVAQTQHNCFHGQVLALFFGIFFCTLRGNDYGNSHNENLFIGLSCKIYAALKAAKRVPLPAPPGVISVSVCMCLRFKGLSTR